MRLALRAACAARGVLCPLGRQLGVLQATHGTRASQQTKAVVGAMAQALMPQLRRRGDRRSERSGGSGRSWRPLRCDSRLTSVCCRCQSLCLLLALAFVGVEEVDAALLRGREDDLACGGECCRAVSLEDDALDVAAPPENACDAEKRAVDLRVLQRILDEESYKRAR